MTGNENLRILIAGSSGSGKTSLCRELSLALNLPFTEIDYLYHGQGWIPLPDFEERVDELTRGQRWVMEWSTGPRARSFWRGPLTLCSSTIPPVSRCTRSSIEQFTVRYGALSCGTAILNLRCAPSSPTDNTFSGGHGQPATSSEGSPTPIHTCSSTSKFSSSHILLRLGAGSNYNHYMSESVRVDVWLWAVRQLKTRTLATNTAKAGHVRVNGDPAKPAQKVKVGDEIRLRIEGQDRILEVTKLIVKRTSAPIAQGCYIDHTPPREKVFMPPLFKRERGAGRPTKKERREMDRLRGLDANWGRFED